jgi:hypothetical protein
MACEDGTSSILATASFLWPPRPSDTAWQSMFAIAQSPMSLMNYLLLHLCLWTIGYYLSNSLLHCEVSPVGDEDRKLNQTEGVVGGDFSAWMMCIPVRKCSITSNNLSLYLPTYLPIYLPTYLPAYLPAYLPTYLFVCLSIYLSIYLGIYVPMYLYTDIHFRIYIYMHTYVYRFYV